MKLSRLGKKDGALEKISRTLKAFSKKTGAACRAAWGWTAGSFRKGGLRPWSSRSASIPFPPGDWRYEVLSDFAEWLAEVESPPPLPVEPSNDFVEVLAELAALRQEMQRQNREQQAVGEGMARMGEAHRELVSRLESGLGSLEALESAIREKTEKSVFLHFADLRDTLQRGLREVERSSQKGKFLWKPPPGLESCEEGYQTALARFQGYETALEQFRQGYAMALERFDRILTHMGIEKVPVAGCPFDPSTMMAVGTRPAEGGEEGTVAEELVSGYTRGEEVLRSAQVVVAVARPVEEAAD